MVGIMRLKLITFHLKPCLTFTKFTGQNKKEDVSAGGYCTSPTRNLGSATLTYCSVVSIPHLDFPSLII